MTEPDRKVQGEGCDALCRGGAFRDAFSPLCALVTISVLAVTQGPTLDMLQTQEQCKPRNCCKCSVASWVCEVPLPGWVEIGGDHCGRGFCIWGDTGPQYPSPSNFFIETYLWELQVHFMSALTKSPWSMRKKKQNKQNKQLEMQSRRVQKVKLHQCLEIMNQCYRGKLSWCHPPHLKQFTRYSMPQTSIK